MRKLRVAKETEKFIVRAFLLVVDMEGLPHKKFSKGWSVSMKRFVDRAFRNKMQPSESQYGDDDIVTPHARWREIVIVIKM